MPEATASIGLGTVWLLGASMGLTACAASCLPFIGTWALGRAGGDSEAFRHTLSFLTGRVLAYTLLALVAGMAGLSLARALGGIWGSLAIGGTSILAGLWLLVGKRSAGCSKPSTSTQTIRWGRPRDATPPFLMGAALALTPCTPLTSLLAVAAQAEDPLRGASFGLVFGIGATVTPILLLVPLAGRLGMALREERDWLTPWLMRAAGLVLILLGLRRIIPLI
ncbi:sulfite exporter TauE/SafE family protein [Azonexus sp.]|jgi:cytochrome c biogenesis protein CcdA|uniref:sulfite exporter TauE/SafE family protein n=1 Tax=Azonexus sp. TaxID=1872668 RepID=UPI00281C2882|nr:sulfite exporter TauE/SafE family protein [Azonexus sp.]MDR1995614.1 sulfite exporter TauE/SafE family protein [Azonexus sp.]